MSKNINKLLKQAQRMQSQMVKAQEELAKQEIEGSAGGGMVTLKLNGSGELQSLKIKSEVVNPAEVEMLEDLIVAAYHTALDKVKETTSGMMSNITGGMQIPGLM